MRFPLIGVATGALLAFAVAVFLPGCQVRSDGGEPEAEGAESERVGMDGQQRVFLGNITMVNERSKFVLIKTPVNQRLDAGIPLESFREGQRTADLLFSPEQSFGFMTADISHGEPAVGDGVYLRHTEDFETSMSPRMQRAMAQHEREQNMGFFEKWRYNREKKREARKKKRRE